MWSQANENNTRLISDIAEVYKADENHAIPKLRKAIIKQINEGRAKNEQQELTDEEEEWLVKYLYSLEELYSISNNIQFLRFVYCQQLTRKMWQRYSAE